MGNVDSQCGSHGFYGDRQRQLSRKRVSRSLRLSGKQSYRAASGKPEHRNSETSTRSSSTPSIPQSLAEHGLEPFDDHDAGLPDFSAPIWVDRVAMNLRPMTFHTEPTGAAESTENTQDRAEPQGDARSPQHRDSSSLKKNSKKRSKSADMWREDSLEVSLSDVSLENLTSTEEMADAPDSTRANSLDELYGPQSHGRYTKRQKGGSVGADSEEDKMLSPCDDDGANYGAFTLPCRRSHCLSEGVTSHQGAMQGRRAQTIQDVTAADGSELEDSGIDGLIGDSAASQPRRYKAMSASFSAYSTTAGGAFAGSDSGSSSGAGPAEAVQGVYENFRQELEKSVCQAERAEERASALSDEHSSVTLSSAYHTEPLLGLAYHTEPLLGAAAAQGSVRKAGRLTVKNLLVHKKNKKVELAARRKWKSYWVSLKGCTLFFYETDGRSGIDHTSVPKHAVWAENSIVQAVPEHPKKDFVFCLSNSMGDSYLFQTSSQTELENWVTAIHSACAAAFARQHHRDDTVRLLRSEIRKLEQKIDMDEKMKKMGDMQLASVTDTKKRKTILEQIFLWEQNLEQFHMDLFRFRCYLSSLQGGELPNPKRLLAFASRPTKLAMGRLGIFSVSSFHALVAARTECGVRRRTHAMSRSTSKRKSRFSSLWGLETSTKRKNKTHPSIEQVFAEGEEPVRRVLEEMFDESRNAKDDPVCVKGVVRPSAEQDAWAKDHLTPSWVCLPNGRPVLAIVRPGESALDTLETICKAHGLDSTKHYLRLKFLIETQVQFYIPKPEEDVHDLLYKEIELCSKIRKVIQFDRDESCMIGYGFSISVVEDDSVQQLYITDVKAGGLAFAKGLNAGDEILQLNGKNSSTLTFSDMKAAFSQASLSLTVNTLPPVDRRQHCFLPPRRSDSVQHLYTDIFSQNQEEILDDGVGLISETSGDSLDDDSELFSEYDDYRKSTEQVAAFCRSLHEMNPSSEVVSPSSGPESSTGCVNVPRQLSHADKLRKVIWELVETERTYVKDLNCLIGRYLTPLQKESFLTQDELDVLFGNLPEMVEFQVEFLRTLEDGTRLVPDLEKLERVEQFKKILFSLGGSFLYYADRFKIYSAFCASHTKVPKVLVKAKTDPAFKAFLDERNPKQQHSSTLESYLIKPIQRVLKYPLLLRELYTLTDPDSEEHYHLDVAMKAMNKVASHINEMQKLHEEFGAVFDQLISEQTGEKKEVADLSMGDLLLHTMVTWLNPPSSLGKWKKEPQLATFVFKTAVVFVCKDCSKQKKKMGGSHRASVSGEEKDPFRFRHMISTSTLQVRALTSADGDSASVCEIVHVKSESEGRPERVFHLCCSSPESKKDFLRTVHSILRDKQRRQLLKTESLPPSQQYVPFGGKRLCALKGARPTMNRAASAPTRTLGRRKLVRNRFTIDTDIVFDTDADPDADSPDSQHALQPGDTDRWVEEQFDLQRYEEQEQEQMKETDILSDEDEEGDETEDFSQSTLSPSAEPELEGQVSALTLDEDEQNASENKDSKAQHALRLSHLGKQCAVSVASVDEQAVPGDDVVWVRRDVSSNESEEQNPPES
ncbi:T-lymphoma invasion and metastasis-inducing protein 1 isoform X1 [Pygocentrus nattereri]|uniref:T-lymphoma invasion and metastasis-inducing protein 1 isoform X1 n=1 Tax=Pygocentrus nattereri TaxID=42514 RepID=UPI000814A19C|nr:T-lymphoma invasion and metastasis-inducing protein 1 isoform X1 [Pygocentrus nattereri]XP_017538028.1 T-lymphoma invasion and metastasis-inducing protein 1 isoform X1 [Pygocentrus nattereri]XP_017538029.1 T-lymphoma invasion and metastasis-inducing protein 1 isoform X1 [Pygocentrus nattereri]XP_037402746.1 T-lymphoma invasion and metastasis-inducing protein 1 isoform X1 [Pygocentrus nattereri]